MLTDNDVSAPLWRRLFAMAYDCFLLFALALAYTAIHLFIKAQIFGVALIKKSAAGTAGDPILFINVVILYCLFFYWFWTRNGQTLGMQSWRLRVEQQNGQNITAKQAAIRLLVAPASMLCFGMGYLYCLSNKRQTWHDRASETRVVLTPKAG